MARAIDIQPIIEEIQSSLEIPSYSEHDKGFDDGLKYVLDLIEKTPTLTPPNEPLTCEGCKFEYEATDEAMCEQCIRSPAYRDYYRRPQEGEADEWK